MKYFPKQNIFFLPTRELSQRKRTSPLWFIVIVLSTLFLIALVADNLGFTSIAQAQTIQPIHDNAYYCDLIEKTGEPVSGASSKEIKKVCDNYK